MERDLMAVDQPSDERAHETQAVLDTAAIERLLPDQPHAAAAQLLDAARAGHAAAQAWLAQLYLDGRGVPRAPAEALYWFQRSAHAGVPMAMNMLGRCYENGWGTPENFTLAAVWYRRGAEAGLDWAVYNYAQMLANGRGVAKDRAQALRWFERAVAMGHARAMHFLGQFHEYGWEVPADRAKAFALYQRSAAGGDYRGLCSWASVLAERGQIEQAEHSLRQAIPLAPAHYLEPLAAELARSRWPTLARLAEVAASRLRQITG
jgi:TPR repeat protein